MGKHLCVKYKEEGLKQGEVKARILDSNRETLIQFPLTSKYGSNKYVINLEELPYQWEEETNYWFELIGGKGIQYTILFQLLPPVLLEEPVVDIISDVKYVNCKELDQSLVDFYGEIISDNYPCRLEWNVSNDEGTPLLNSIIETIDADQVSTITITNIPPYTVSLLVEDACGNEQIARVNVTCSTFKKSKLHIYLENGVKSKRRPSLTN